MLYLFFVLHIQFVELCFAIWNFIYTFVINIMPMKIIKKKPLVDFYEKHADAKTPLEEWHSKTKKADWNNFSDFH